MAEARMTVQDELWLTMDRPNNLMVVDGAMILRGDPPVEDVRDSFLRLADRFPVFGRRAVRRGRSWVWQDDPEFDIARHVLPADVPGHVSIEAVQRFMSEQRSVPLDLDRPRWVVHVISGVELPDGGTGSAVILRFHHAIADGVRLTQLMLSMCDGDEGGIEALVARRGTAEGEQSTRSAVGHAVSSAGRGASDVVSEGLHALRHPRDTAAHLPESVRHGVGAAEDLAGRVAGAARLGTHGFADGLELARHPDRLLDALEVLGVADHRSLNDVSSVTKLALGATPHAVWTGHPGTEKAVSWTEPIPLATIKSIGTAAGATVNDVLLAAVAGALRRYLEQHGDLVDEIYWMVPVNLKPFADNLPEDLGNYFALVVLPMALYHDDSAERLSHMHHVMDRIKHSDEAVLTFGIQRAISQSPMQIAAFLTNFFANKAVGVLTNVPGPRNELRFMGVPVEQFVGFAPCSGNQPMTMTIFSYNGGVTVGFATDAGLVPDPDVLSDLVAAEISAMSEQFR